ncbi:proline-rich protein 36-like [Schistocerca nitens]|uniref:proline-rich protein 36-like n=1 Tax=Schistocerca nitens TaxID=7011 RepID=UPI0021196150|nr:proline-rich protein 36-like [Schistocerca nitens]
MCSREKDVPALASDAKGVADRRPAALAPSAAPCGPPLTTTNAMAMDLMDTSPETMKTALSAPLPDSEDESSAAPQPRGRSGKQKRRATAATSVVRSSPIEKRAKQDFAPDADGFVPARRTARRMQSSTTLPTAVANSFDALADAPDQLTRVADVPVQTEDLRSRRGPVHYRGCEVWKRAIDCQRGQTPAPRPKKPATRRPGVSFAAATSGAPSAVPAASAAPAPAASEAVPPPAAPAPPPQLLVADPGTASPGTSAGPRPADRRREGCRPMGAQRSAPSVAQPQVDSPSEAATPPPSSDGAAPAASTADLANLVAQLTALVTTWQIISARGVRRAGRCPGKSRRVSAGCRRQPAVLCDEAGRPPSQQPPQLVTQPRARSDRPAGVAAPHPINQIQAFWLGRTANPHSARPSHAKWGRWLPVRPIALSLHPGKPPARGIRKYGIKGGRAPSSWPRSRAATTTARLLVGEQVASLADAFSPCVSATCRTAAGGRSYILRNRKLQPPMPPLATLRFCVPTALPFWRLRRRDSSIVWPLGASLGPDCGKWSPTPPLLAALGAVFTRAVAPRQRWRQLVAWDHLAAAEVDPRRHRPLPSASPPARDVIDRLTGARAAAVAESSPERRVSLAEAQPAAESASASAPVSVSVAPPQPQPLAVCLPLPEPAPDDLYNLTQLAEVSLAAAAGRLFCWTDADDRPHTVGHGLPPAPADRAAAAATGEPCVPAQPTPPPETAAQPHQPPELVPPPPPPPPPQSPAHAQAQHACPDCGKRYSTASNLARHRQTHRGPADAKARRCAHCGKVYVSVPAFSMHVRTHAQACRCPYCGKCFSRPWLLQGHIRTHTGEKPFKCTICEKAFADKSNLRAHVQTHSSTKPHVCCRCGKAFALKSYLYKHEESSCVRLHSRGPQCAGVVGAA